MNPFVRILLFLCPSHAYVLVLHLRGSGTGSELLVYDVRLANLVETFQVFEGVRVHGISLQSPDNNDDPFCSAADFIIAIYGERRVKLFLLCIRLGLNDGAGSNLGVRLELIQRLPGFDHWVLDVCFLKVLSQSELFGALFCFFYVVTHDQCRRTMFLQWASVIIL